MSIPYNVSNPSTIMKKENMKILPTVDAALARVQEHEQQRHLDELEAVNAKSDSYEYLVAVRRSPAVPLGMKVRVARELLQYERPKLGVSVNVNMGDDFAARLDAAIARSNGHAPKVIEGSAVKVSAETMAKPMLPNAGSRMRRI
jgi:hypothetical protein